MEDREYRLEQLKIRQGWTRIAVSACIPIVLGFLTYSVNAILQEREAQFSREAQVLAQKQMLNTEIGSDLNVIFSYVSDIR